MKRTCYCCGKKGLTEGYVLNSGEEYYCSEKCVTMEFDETYGEYGWEWQEEENTLGGYIRTDEEGDMDIFWTEWELGNEESWGAM